MKLLKYIYIVKAVGKNIKKNVGHKRIFDDVGVLNVKLEF